MGGIGAGGSHDPAFAVFGAALGLAGHTGRPPGWDADTVAWALPAPLTVQPVHALHDAALLGVEARGGHGWTQAASAHLTALLLHMACDEAALWRHMPGMAPLTVTVRLPAIACDRQLPAQTEAALACTGLPAGLVRLNICRNTVGPAGPGELLIWSALRDLGVGLALHVAPDLASICPATLGRLPFTSLCLPHQIADRIVDSPSARRLVREAVRVARSHAALVTATGLRTAAQRDILAELGCDAAQGPLFGLPMHPAVFQAALAGDAMD